MAGALGVQLGGLNYYQGMPSLRARLGDPKEPLEPGHIEAAIRMLLRHGGYLSGIITAAWVLLARW